MRFSLRFFGYFLLLFAVNLSLLEERERESEYVSKRDWSQIYKHVFILFI